MMEELKLRECPFCNGEAQLISADPQNPGDYWHISCALCNASSYGDVSLAATIAAWNARAPSPEVTALVAALRRIVNETNGMLRGVAPVADSWLPQAIAALVPFKEVE